MNKHPVITITDALGADAMSQRLGVTPHSIRHARATKAFPASWYAPLLDMCAAAGIDCPLNAFNWKTPNEARLDAGAA
jgi:hypothetical protein